MFYKNVVFCETFFSSIRRTNYYLHTDRTCVYPNCGWLAIALASTLLLYYYSWLCEVKKNSLSMGLTSLTIVSASNSSSIHEVKKKHHGSSIHDHVPSIYPSITGLLIWRRRRRGELCMFNFNLIESCFTLPWMGAEARTHTESCTHSVWQAWDYACISPPPSSSELQEFILITFDRTYLI